MLKNNVETLLYKANITKYELAKRCDFKTVNGRIVSSTVDNAINNKNITVESALKIFQVLKDVDVCERFEDVFFLDRDGLSISASQE